MIVVDICSGYGGWSEAALKRGHTVIRIDNNPVFADVPNTIIMDVRNIQDLDLPEDVTLMLLAPPCKYLSLASVYHHWDKKGRPKHLDTIEALRIVGWCLDAVDYIKPKYWILENPQGMLRNFLNRPGVALPGVTTWMGSWGGPSIKPTDLWGQLPPMEWPEKPKEFTKGAGCGKGGRDLRPSDPARRAIIPYALSEAVCIAVENAII